MRRREAPGWVAGPIATALLWLTFGWRIVAVLTVAAVGLVILGVVMRDG